MLSFTSVGQSSPDASQNIQTMRLRDDPPPITQPSRPTKKRKSPPNDTHQQQSPQQSQPPPPQPPQQPMQHVLPPPHALMHPMPGQMPPGYPYPATDYTPGGMPPPPHPGLSIQQQQQPPPQQQQQQQAQSTSPGTGSRALSTSKRAEQNRKAQRAFRERRDQHVKALESRSQLLDAALASADEANRRWEECRALVDQLRVENAALRAALSQAHLLPPNLNTSATQVQAQSEESKKAGESTQESKPNATEHASDQQSAS